jgi:hypothetical protein
MTFGSFTEIDLDSDSESFDNFGFTNFDFTNNSTSSREVFTDLYDGVTDPKADKNTTATYHQICVIAGASREEDEESEAFDDLCNPYVDPIDLMRGTGNKYIGTAPREKVQLPQEAWDRAARSMSGAEPMTTQATLQALQAYQYKLARFRHDLEKTQQELDKRKAVADASSERRANLSRQSRTSGNSHRDARAKARSRLAGIPEQDRENLIQNLDMSFMSIDTRGHIIPKTLEAGYMATHAFLMASKPPHGDPRASLYQMAMAGVGVMGTEIAGREIAPQAKSAPCRNSPRQHSP